MRISLYEVVDIDTLDPFKAEQYLRENGWKDVRVVGNGAAIEWQRGDWRALLPVKRTVPDLPFRITEFIRNVASAQGMSEMEVFRAITFP